MAEEKELEIKIKWQNAAYYEMKAKCEHCEDEDFITIVKVDENTNMARIWPNVEAICQDYFESHMRDIGTEMRS